MKQAIQFLNFSCHLEFSKRSNHLVVFFLPGKERIKEGINTTKLVSTLPFIKYKMLKEESL
ncbi:MAG: hypothetical protein MK226_13640 [Saprospiraceae bacterium]|nr:hypothetical protein [Saprospiraceae bacterium]